MGVKRAKKEKRVGVAESELMAVVWEERQRSLALKKQKKLKKKAL